MDRKSNLKNIDWLTLSLYLILVFLGWMNIYAAVYNEQHQSIFDMTERYGKQLIWILTAFVIAIVIFIIDVKFYSFFAYLLFGLAVLSLILVLLFGKEIHGARSWFQFGSFHFQPSEFAKVATALALARCLSAHNFKINQFKSVVKILLIILLPAMLIAIQPDLGSAMMFLAFILVIYREGFSIMLLFMGLLLLGLFFLSLLMDKLIIISILIGISFILIWLISRSFKLFVKGLYFFLLTSVLVYSAGYLLNKEMSYYYVLLITTGLFLPFSLAYAYRKRIRNIYLVVLFLTGSVIFTFSIDHVFHEVLEKHQQDRVNILLGLESDPLGLGYNVAQSKIAIGSGGITGKGFLRGTQTKFDFVPEQSTDFIFCTVGEEWGFLGATFIIVLFIWLLIRLVLVAERQRSVFSRIYGYGVVAILFIHFAVNIGMTIGIFPVIGIPLPFFSYGGSSLWAFTILLFILLRMDASRMDLLY